MHHVGERQMTSLKKARENGYSRSRHSTLDPIDIQIIDELLANADISSTEIASRLKVPLSTIQRRRAILQDMSILNHKYKLNPLSFGLRPVEFWVKVEGGKAEEVANHIFEKFDNVIRATIQMNTISNVGILAYFDSSEEVFGMLELIKSMRYVISVEFAEIVKVVNERRVNFFKTQERHNFDSLDRQT